MADNRDRNSKAAKRSVANPTVDSTNNRKTHVADPTHIAYVDRTFPIGHLTPKARQNLGFPADHSELR